MTYTGRFSKLTRLEREARADRPTHRASYYALRRLVVAEREPVDAETLELLRQRPQTRGECGEERPCPWVACRHHLALDVNPESGTIKLNTDRDAAELEHSCSLDVADAGAHKLQDVAKLLGVTRERVRQIERIALRKLGKTERP